MRNTPFDAARKARAVGYFVVAVGSALASAASCTDQGATTPSGAPPIANASAPSATSAAAVASAVNVPTVAPVVSDFVPTKDDETAFGKWVGCFAVRDLQKGTLTHLAGARCSVRLPPCSTFKVFNTLAGVETGVLKDETTTFKWSGQKYDRPELNHDHTLQSAMADSVLWYFQEVATGVGAERMQSFLDRANYGNRDMSSGLTTFWLGGSLLISADEQTAFLARVYAGDVPFSPRSIDILKKVLPSALHEGATDVVGKTGFGVWDDGRPDLGWFVGHAQGPAGEQVFAVNIEGKGALGREAKRIALQLLKAHDYVK